MRRALFVCMGNTCRSPMAAAVARRILGDKVIVESTGISASRGAPAAQHAIEVMAERELNIRDHSARGIDSVDLSAFDLIVAMDAEVAKGLRSRGVDAAKLIELNVDDPFGEDIEYYRRTAESIELRLRRFFRHRRAGKSNSLTSGGDATGRLYFHRLFSQPRRSLLRVRVAHVRLRGSQQGWVVYGRVIPRLATLHFLTHSDAQRSGTGR